MNLSFDAIIKKVTGRSDTKQVENPEDMVWVDDGEGPVLAVTGDEYDSRPTWIHKPKQIKRKDVQPGMTILSVTRKKLYDNCIMEVEARRRQKKDKAVEP